MPQDGKWERKGGKLTGDEGVGGRLERAKAVADDEDTGAEAAEALGLDAGDADEGADGVEAQAVAIVAQDPGGVADRGQGIRAGQDTVSTEHVVVES